MMLIWWMWTAQAEPEATPVDSPTATEAAVESDGGEPLTTPSDTATSSPAALRDATEPSAPLQETGTPDEVAPEAPEVAVPAAPAASPVVTEPMPSYGPPPLLPRPAPRPRAPEPSLPPWSLRAPDDPPATSSEDESLVASLLSQLVPTLGRRGPRALFGLAILALLSLVAAGAARSFRSRLRPVGVLPSLMVGLEIVGRAAAVVVAITAIVALLPVGIVPALTWIAIGAALAVGWSLGEILPDVLAWLVLTTEGQLGRGVWVRAGEHHGAIEAVNLRSVAIIDAQGQRISIPNRVLLRQPIQAATDSFPKTHVTLRLADVDAAQARTVLWESAMLSPWLAPSTTPEIGQDPIDPSHWHVAVRLLEGAYEDDFAGSFPERVREVLAAHDPADA